MVRTLLGISLIFACHVSAVKSQTRWTQDFQGASFPPPGWVVQFGGGTSYWSRASVGAYGLSDASASFEFYSAPGGTMQSIVSPAFSPTSPGDVLQFDCAYATYVDEIDSLILESSTDGGANFARVIGYAGGPIVGTGIVTAPPDPDFFVPGSTQWGTKQMILPPATNCIRFKTISAFGNNLYLDNIRLFTPYTNDAGMVRIDRPNRFINLPFALAPRVTIKNFGTTSQTSPFVTKCTVSGPGGFSYLSTVAETLGAGLSRTIIFPDSIRATIPGPYVVETMTLLSGDQNQANDTLRMSLSAGNFNFGDNGGLGTGFYYFANSIPGNQAPSAPTFSWIDTTGSTDLLVNGSAVQPITGNVDDGFFRIASFLPGHHFRLFGTEYGDTLFISTNGILSLRNGTTAYAPMAVPSLSAPTAAMFALWMDFDFSDPDIPVNRISYKTIGNTLIITFANAPRYNPETDASDFVSFQVVLLFPQSASSNSAILVNYDSARTGQSFLRACESVLFPHLVGAQDQTGQHAVVYRFATPGQTVVPGPLDPFPLAVEFGYSPRVNLRVFLQGPYNSALQMMDRGLNTGGILAAHFAGLPIPAEAVDSIAVEIRDDSTAANATIRQSEPAWLMSDGTLRSFADTTKRYTRYSGAPPGNYYVVVRHRNHLAIMTSSPLALTNSTPATFDLSLAQSQAYGTNPMVQLGGRYAMYAGDENQSGIVTAFDANEVFGGINSTGYDSRDINLSGIISAADANTVFGNLNAGTQVNGAFQRVNLKSQDSWERPRLGNSKNSHKSGVDNK